MLDCELFNAYNAFLVISYSSFFFFQVEKNRVFSRLVLYQWDFLITIINEV